MSTQLLNEIDNSSSRLALPFDNSSNRKRLTARESQRVYDRFGIVKSTSIALVGLGLVLGSPGATLGDCEQNAVTAVWSIATNGYNEDLSSHLDEDVELESPNWYLDALSELEARGFVRINDPRHSLDLES